MAPVDGGGGPAPVDVVVVGDQLTDTVVKLRGAPAPGSDTPAEIASRPGGQGANQAAWLADAGVAVGLVARVGATDLEVRAAQLRTAGVVPLLAGDPERPSGAIVVLVGPDGRRDFYSDRGAAAALGPAEVARGAAAARRWLHVSGYALVGEHGAEVAAVVAAEARRRGLGCSVDPASVSELARLGPAVFLERTAGMALTFPNHEEAALLTGEADPVRAARALAAHHGTAVVTCGADGAVAVSGGRVARVAAAHARVVDTTGAGDAFAAAHLAATLAGADLDACLAAGAAAAARAVSALGAWPSGLGRRRPEEGQRG